MPFTPFHFGHSLPIVFADMKHKRIDAISSIVGSIVIDIEPIIILIFGLNLPLHGFVHSFFSATILGLLVGFFFHLTKDVWIKILSFFKWEQSTSLKNKIFWGIVMANIHVFLDSTMYIEMNPFLFVSGNPFYGLIDQSIVYICCLVSLVVGLILFGINILRSIKK